MGIIILQHNPNLMRFVLAIAALAATSMAKKAANPMKHGIVTQFLKGLQNRANFDAYRAANGKAHKLHMGLMSKRDKIVVYLNQKRKAFGLRHAFNMARTQKHLAKKRGQALKAAGMRANGLVGSTGAKRKAAWRSLDALRKKQKAIAAAGAKSLATLKGK